MVLIMGTAEMYRSANIVQKSADTLILFTCDIIYRPKEVVIHEYMNENCTGQYGPIKQGKLHRVPEHFITEVGAHLMKPSVMVITCK